MTTSVPVRALFQAAAMTAALAFSAATAKAQFGEAAGIADAMQADYLRRDIVLFQQGLDLDDSQRDVVEALYGDYEQSFEDGLARMRKRIEDMREELQTTDVDRVLRIVFKPIEEWGDEKRGLGEKFLEDVRIILTPEQQEQWPKFERFLFREKNLSKGSLSGETLNLFYIVRDMELAEPEMQAVQPVLDAYDVALDEALRRRQQTLISNRSDMLKSFSEQNSAVSLAILQRQIDTRIAVRAANDEYIERLAEVMPADRREEFRQKALERAYPRIYRQTPVQHIFSVARELEGLEPSVLGSVISLEANYLAELKVMNDELARLLKQWEPREERLRAEAFAQRMAGQQPGEIQDQTREPFLRRDELSRSYTRQLKGVLTEEQFGQLPGGYRWADLPGEVKPPTDKPMAPEDAVRRGSRGAAKPTDPTGSSGEGGGEDGGSN